jgi:CO/xanthine dehydrogenase Mo-binding subunit
MPQVETMMVEVPEPSGPFGAKGAGESTMVPVAPAILNAVADATGARVTDLPARPDRVLAAMSGQGRNRQDMNRQGAKVATEKAPGAAPPP